MPMPKHTRVKNTININRTIAIAITFNPSTIVDMCVVPQHGVPKTFNPVFNLDGYGEMS